MEDCIFCKIVNGVIPSKKVYEDEKVLVFMDINPICDGHMLIIPKKHYVTVFDLPEDILFHMYKIANQMIEKTMKIGLGKGATISFNYGDKQEVKHVHMHIMPNFNKKAAKNIDELYERIIKA